LTPVANRYASHLERSILRASVDLVLACAPMTSLVTGLGLAAAGWLVNAPGVAASGTLVAGVGLYVERLQARSLRRRRRAERMRSRHEVTELRRTIAQLRIDVDAFQRALIDTGAVLTARAVPLLAPVPAAPAPAPVPVAAPVVVASALDAWVQTPNRDAAEHSPLPAQQPSPFVAAGGSLPVVPELPPRRTFDTGGIPVLDPAPRDRLTVTTDALVYAALDGLDEQERTRRLAYAEAEAPDDALRNSA
jgi:hypothetical protein